MRFRKTESVEVVAKYLADVLQQKLADGKKVLWLVPGGSAMAVTVAASKLLAKIDQKNLTISLTDERFGPPGHADSNWSQMDRAGAVFPGARLVPVLTGQPMAATVNDFADNLRKAFDGADFRLGLFGIGPDGHTAGILPDSPALNELNWVCGYDAGTFKRITMTPPAIAALDQAVVYATGSAKAAVLLSLSNDLPINQQPAQALKKVKNLLIYNDQIGEKI